MGSRERKREERRKRKRRSSEVTGGAPPRTDGAGEDGGASEADAAGSLSRSELKDAEARAALEPLHEGERPLVVTIGAALAGAIALFNIVAYAAQLDLQGSDPTLLQVLIPTLLMGVASIGMWRGRYWAVLGFQVILVLLLAGSAIGLVQAGNAWQVVGFGAVLLISGTLFFFMVKALARIQMPQRLPPK